jgi:hypothetical protein
MRYRLCGGLGGEDAQTLIVEVALGVPASKSKLTMTPEVLAFRGRLEAEIAAAIARGWMISFTPEFVTLARRSETLPAPAANSRRVRG